jgi:hypothetical protein
MSHTDAPAATRCPICRIVEAANGQSLDVAIALFKIAAKMHCRCPGKKKHRPLLTHPHCQEGCVGFEPETSA